VTTASLDTMRAALRAAPEIERALAQRTQALRAAGFEPQVDDMPGLSLVFMREGSRKRRLAVNETVGTPAVLTPNVLLRPILEHALLPTVAYWAGPGELAYFAQVSAVAEAMERPAPLGVPRWSCMLLEPHIEAVLRRLGLQLEDLSTPHAAERRLARESMAPATASGIAALRAEISALSERLGPEPGALRLDAVVQGAMASLHHRVDRLERRLLAGIARRETDRMRDLGTARGALYPFDERQERTLNLIPFLARHGVELLRDMHAAASSYAEAMVAGTGARAQPSPAA
jgi:uncharacterized protein YllA (UPF0747 family)